MAHGGWCAIACLPIYRYRQAVRVELKLYCLAVALGVVTGGFLQWESIHTLRGNYHISTARNAHYLPTVDTSLVGRGLNLLEVCATAFQGKYNAD